MVRPRLIILVRHGQSEGNKNREVHQSTPDHRVKLTPEGLSQAHDAGRRLRNLLRPDDTLHFFTSPYRRTRETTEGILETLTSDDPEPSPFRRDSIKVYEEPRLREQDFGNFQPCSAEMERIWQERADYGHFFYRIPHGESAADAYDRISGFNESLWRQFGEDDFASVCVLVTHGMMSRVFLMKWYHFSVEYFEDLRNINHCEFLVMRKQENGKYLLENKLRTWSEMRKERKEANPENGKDDVKDKQKLKHTTSSGLTRSKTIVPQRRWGGCPNGCNHSSHYKKREDLESMRQRDTEQAMQRMGLSTSNGSSPKRPQYHYRTFSSDGDDEHSDAVAHHGGNFYSIAEAAALKPLINPSAGANGSSKNLLSLRKLESGSSSGRPFYHDHLHLGRDFGGTYSGHNSATNSDFDHSGNEEDHEHEHDDDDDGDEDNDSNSQSATPLARQPIVLLEGKIRAAAEEGAIAIPLGAKTHSAESLGRGGVQAPAARVIDKVKGERLGDMDPETEGEAEKGVMEDLDEAEKEDRSIRGSVY